MPSSASITNNQIRPSLGAELNLGGVDGDALITLGLQGVQQKGPFERHAALDADLFHILKLAFGQGPGFIENTAHQGGLAMVHVTDDDDTKGNFTHNRYP